METFNTFKTSIKFTGHGSGIDDGQARGLQTLARAQNLRTIAETGLGFGLSAAALLSLPETIGVVSFDINQWAHNHKAKQLLDNHFPDRHTWIIGDSLETVPAWEHKGRFDLVFIDGSYDPEVAYGDIRNAVEHLLRPGGYVAVGTPLRELLEKAAGEGLVHHLHADNERGILYGNKLDLPSSTRIVETQKTDENTENTETVQTLETVAPPPPPPVQVEKVEPKPATRGPRKKKTTTTVTTSVI